MNTAQSPVVQISQYFARINERAAQATASVVAPRSTISGQAVPQHLGMTALISNARDALREESTRMAQMPHAYDADDRREHAEQRELVAKQIEVAKRVPDVYRLLADFVEAAELADSKERAAWTNYCVARARKLLDLIA